MTSPEQTPAAAAAGDGSDEPEAIATTLMPRQVLLEKPVLSVRTLVTASIAVLLLVGLVLVLRQMLDLLLLVLVAIVFAEGIRPLVQYLQRARIPRPLAIVIVYLGVLAGVGAMIALLVQPIINEAQNLANSLPDYQKSAEGWLADQQQRFHISGDPSGQLGNIVSQATSTLLTIGGYIVGAIVNLVLVLVLGFLWLVTADRLKAFVVDLFPVRHQPLAADVFREMGFRMGGYLRATVINMVAVGLATGVVCWVIGLPSPLLLGIFAGLSAAIPLVGPFLGVIPPVLLGLTIDPGTAIKALVLLLVVQLVDANTIVPVVMNRVVALPALAVVISLLVGTALAGFSGALLAVPIASVLQVLLLRVLVPYVHLTQGRHDQAYAEAFTPLSEPLRAGAPSHGGRRSAPR